MEAGPVFLDLQTMSDTDWNLQRVLDERAVTTLYQPLVSIKRRAVLGYEALSRGVLPGAEAFIPPAVLFGMAGDSAARLALDRLCRDRAMQGFTALHRQRRDLVLSLNMDVSVLDQGIVGTNYLLEQARRWGLNPNNVVLEILEADVEDTEALIAFTRAYRSYGFLIAIDDIGTGHSNLERVAQVRPEIIKIDRSLISGVHSEFHKQEVTKALVNMAQKTGALVVAEGVETEQEAMCLLQMGIDVFQGWFFARPGPLNGDFGCRDAVDGLALRFREHVLAELAARKERFRAYDLVLGGLLAALRRVEPKGFEAVLVESIAAHPDIECFYILDERGIQVSDTVCNPYVIAENKRFIYQPAQRGADHSLKPYYLPVSAGLSRFTTEPYVSLASGNRCTTIAVRFTAADGLGYVACLDIGQAD
jgi:EAL domain-containing protein (putative c-di-GMP-specific phosphodiesterase class I)